MARIFLVNKPFQVLCQFTDAEGRQTLADFIAESGVYPAGRLDYDSEGLLILTDDGQLQHRLANPRFKLDKRYWVQVEGEIDEAAMDRLRRGVTLKDGPTRPARVRKIKAPDIWPRKPPIRQRANQATSWIEIIISEGRNRQVRRMTAAVGFPTLRLVRTSIADWSLDDLQPGEYREITLHLPVAGRRSAPRGRRA